MRGIDMITKRKLILAMLYAIPKKYTHGMTLYRLKKHYDDQLGMLGLNDSFRTDEHTLLDLLENLKDLLFVEIGKDEHDIYDTVKLTKYGMVLGSHILENDFGYIDRNLVLKQYE
jgi:hypothetical protein